ncbi:hypothetical protein [Marinicrinis sediminis]|uniref:Uncharacterized protein n=1 Tax=Marinicrinis sediminis TaxID=1652465 RepID=A0ABW5R9Y0_9BACL
MNFSPMVVNLLGFKVNAVEKSSVVSLGPVLAADVFVSTKRNQGFGAINGDLSQAWFPLSMVLDSDVADSNSIKNSVI